MPTPKTFTLNDGNEIPWLAFGTGTALYNKDASDLVQLAIKTGIIHLDGAQVYGNEDSLGAGIKASGKPRSELFVTTKLRPLSPGQTVDVKASLQESLKKLGLDYVDLFLIHFPVENDHKKLQDLWRQFEEVQAAGLAKSIGVSNFRVDHLQVILQTARVVPAINQVRSLLPQLSTDSISYQIELHPYVWASSKPIVDFAKQNGIVIESYGGQAPVARVPGGPVDPVLQSVRVRLQETRGAPVTAGQVLSKWLVQRGIVVVTYV